MQDTGGLSIFIHHHGRNREGNRGEPTPTQLVFDIQDSRISLNTHMLIHVTKLFPTIAIPRDSRVENKLGGGEKNTNGD